MISLQFFIFVTIVALVYIVVKLNQVLTALRRMSQANDSIDERGDVDTHAIDIKARRRHLLTLCRRKYVRSKHLGQ